MKKGFTLIELLSVIVVLAIIALITIPVISNVINKARLNALKDSAYGLIEASELYYAQYGSNNVRFDIEDSNITSNDTDKLLSYKGSIKTGVVIINSKGKSTICITDGKNSAYKNYNESSVTLVQKKTCTVPSNTNIVYLDNEATLTELSNQELTDKIASLESEIATLKSNKADKTEVENLQTSVSNINTSLTGLSNTVNSHSTVLSSLNTAVGNLNTAVSNIGSYVFKSYSNTISTNHARTDIVDLNTVLTSGTWLVTVISVDTGGKADVMLLHHSNMGYIQTTEHELYPKGYQTANSATFTYVSGTSRIISIHVGQLYNNESTTIATYISAIRIK